MAEKAINPIFLSRPNLDEVDIQAVVSVLKSGNLVQGKEVANLEEKINSLTGSAFSSAVSNGTASLHLALVALEIGPGDEVIIPAFSYIATANVVELVGATPVFVDIELGTFNINVSQIEEKITSKTKCIMPVHEFGLCANMEEIIRLATSHGLYVIEDAACAIGARIGDQYAGTFGDFGSFSLHPRKSVTSGEGGVVTTKTKELDEKIKTLRNHGIRPGSFPMDFVEAGFNYRLTDFQAALVSSQMRRLPSIFRHKEALVDLYLKSLRTDILLLPSVPDGFTHSWQTFHVVCKDHETRERLIGWLKEHQIFCNYGAQCIPAMSFYLKKYQFDVKQQFPSAYEAYSCGLALPLSETLTSEEVSYVCEIINQFK
ncbi:dTDP-4-amino-4,6-dideoxygalactose transaminase [Algoriphagus aquaeductus]|uniref:dTDP-4-amino-4,6-dideoxygalactose transaminase n=1 Tax=Algoriphagus aquaeductus TaxID=475299 RepID=A0A326RKY1_9BACT|nr:DegT/DnrJ/EryC1/StrS family aminotransferase [Algoriphagus aquaeductus]PZV79105.1 dTDP-4-amino-4,6-dideoxygalactose transaminase [Algoriphagus aquaeductus]